jgi:hypothetical protein
VTAAATRRKRDILESLARLVGKIIVTGAGAVGSIKSVSGGLGSRQEKKRANRQESIVTKVEDERTKQTKGQRSIKRGHRYRHAVGQTSGST